MAIDYLIRGGHVIDPNQGIDQLMDIAISGGKIQAIHPPGLGPTTYQAIDATNKLVTPGLVDIHAHVYGPGDLVNVDSNYGVGAGVTSIVDAGSAGPNEIEDLVNRVISNTTSSVYCLLTNHDWPDGFKNVEKGKTPIDPNLIKSKIDDYPGLIIGIKVAITPPILQAYGLDALRSARTLAEETGLRVMLHIGDIGNPSTEATSARTTSEALSLLAPGDILTHVYSPLTGGPLDENENILPALFEAQDRGVIMDAAMGDYGFSWDAAEKILGQGIRAQTISSDVELYTSLTESKGLMVENRRATGSRIVSELSLLEYMAYFLELGFDLNEIIKMTTATPATVAGIENLCGDLKPGKPADIAILESRNGRYKLADVCGGTREATQALVPAGTLKDGVFHEPGGGPHSWGFEPPSFH